MSSSESKTSFPPTPLSKLSSDVSSVPTDLTVSSSGQQKAKQTSDTDDEIKLLKLELEKKNTLLELTKRECAEEVRKAKKAVAAAEKSRKIDEESTKLRTDLQNQEMNKIQAAITEQLREVTVRQTQLENLNQKLRESADVAKRRLQAFQFDPSRLQELLTMKIEDMSLYESAELFIYQHVQPELDKNAALKKHNTDLETKLNEIIHDVSSLEQTIRNEKRQKETLEHDLKTKNMEISQIKETVRSIDMLNQSLQAKLGEDAHRRGELEAAQDRKDRELAVYKKKIEDLSQDYKLYVSENANLTQTLSSLRQEFNQISLKFNEMEHRSEQGISTLSTFTKKMQEKQMRLLEDLSTSIFQHNLDQNYRDQYLVTIKELVNEQIRTQQYISRVSFERDTLQQNVEKLSTQLNKSQILCAEERLLRSKEEERATALAKECDIVAKQLDAKSSELESLRVSLRDPDYDVKNTKEYKMLLKDLKLLLSHRGEIEDLRQLVLKLNQDS